MRLILGLMAVLALVHVPTSTAVTPVIYAPVIRIGLACQSVCTNMNIYLASSCLQCLYSAGWFPTWTNVSQPPFTLARMPFYEAGLLSVPALPLEFPSPYVSPVILPVIDQTAERLRRRHVGTGKCESG